MDAQLIRSPRLALVAVKPTWAAASVAIADSPGWLKYAKDATATVQSVATIIALVVGAWWVLRRRRTRPRANFKHIVSHVPLDEDTYLVRVTVAVENVGDVLLRLEESIGAIRQVVPLHDQVRPALRARGTLETSEQSKLAWPFIDTRRRDWSGNEIESGESASFEFELFAPRDRTLRARVHLLQKHHETRRSRFGIRRLSTNLNSQVRPIYDRWSHSWGCNDGQ